MNFSSILDTIPLLVCHIAQSSVVKILDGLLSKNVVARKNGAVAALHRKSAWIKIVGGLNFSGLVVNYQIWRCFQPHNVLCYTVVCGDMYVDYACMTDFYMWPTMRQLVLFI